MQVLHAHERALEPPHVFTRNQMAHICTHILAHNLGTLELLPTIKLAQRTLKTPKFRRAWSQYKSSLQPSFTFQT